MNLLSIVRLLLLCKNIHLPIKNKNVINSRPTNFKFFSLKF